MRNAICVKHWDDKKGNTGIFVSALAMHLNRYVALRIATSMQLCA
ncbi:hypothetical protein [Wolbachia endosymbiont (group A) of Sphecodes monilicornis]|nr:hypothetical protein [Wolbachia endosymbiont (group A) of Sphecodes monilicornis]